MRDKEIFVDLLAHYNQVDDGYRTHLENGGEGDEHEESYIYLLRDVIDLICRQEAEIERLSAELRRAEHYLNEMADDWEDWDD